MVFESLGIFETNSLSASLKALKGINKEKQCKYCWQTSFG